MVSSIWLNSYNFANDRLLNICVATCIRERSPTNRFESNPEFSIFEACIMRWTILLKICDALEPK